MKETCLTTAEWNFSPSGDFLWSNTNFGEAVTEPMTPLAWSVLAFSLNDWTFVPRYPTVGNIAGLPYLNISVFATLFHFLGKGQNELLEAMESTIYMRLPESLDISRIPLPWWDRFSSFWLAARVQTKQKIGLQQLDAYLGSNRGWFTQTREQLQNIQTGKELIKLWQEQISPHIKKGVWVVLGTATYSADYTNKLRHDLAKQAGAEDAVLLVGNLAGNPTRESAYSALKIPAESGRNSPDHLLPSLGPLLGLSLLARGEIGRTEYLEKYGHRGPHEFEISRPRPVEDPVWIDGQLEVLRKSSVDIETLLSQQQAAYNSALERLIRRFPQEASSYQARMSESARRGRLREQARSEYVRDRWMVRLFACHAGELIGIGEDVFFLTLEELLANLAGEREALQCISARKREYAWLKTLPVLPSLINGPFNLKDWLEDPHRRNDYYDGNSRTNAKDSGIRIFGSPGSAGQVEGTVRVILNTEDGELLRQGDILVTVQTDIAWTVLFPRAGAIITDVGAPLSHAAIVARELGIPAVVGCGNATQRLRSGDRVRVDGAKGSVEVIE